MTTISSLTTSTLYVSQTTISISSASNSNNDDQQQRRAVSEADESPDRHRHHGGGSFMRNVVQTLQSLGLNFPGKSGGPSIDDSEDDGSKVSSANLGDLLQGFLKDLRQILKQHGIASQSAPENLTQAGAQSSGVPQQPAVSNVSTSSGPSSSATSVAQVQAPTAAPAPAPTATAGAPQTGAVSAPSAATVMASASTQASTPKAIVADVREALHSFLHDLRQALKLSAERRQGTRYDDDDRRDGREFGRNGYGKFTDNLQNLIAALAKGDSAGSGKYKELRESFNRLVELLDSSTNGKKPTLAEFLNKLAGNSGATNPAPTAKGAIISATA